MFCEECKQEFGSASLYAAHLCTPTEDRQRIADLEAQLALVGDDAKTFRHLLNIAQQVYGFEFVGQAFTEIQELRAKLAAAKQQVDSGLDSLIDAMGDEGLELDLAIIPRACAVIRSLRAHRDDLKGELAAAKARIEQLEVERRDKFFEDLANNMPDEFGD